MVRTRKAQIFPRLGLVRQGAQQVGGMIGHDQRNAMCLVQLAAQAGDGARRVPAGAAQPPCPRRRSAWAGSARSGASDKARRRPSRPASGLRLPGGRHLTILAIYTLLAALQADGRQHVVEQLAGLADERLALRDPRPRPAPRRRTASRPFRRRRRTPSGCGFRAGGRRYMPATSCLSSLHSMRRMAARRSCTTPRSSAVSAGKVVSDVAAALLRSRHIGHKFSSSSTSRRVIISPYPSGSHPRGHWQYGRRSRCACRPSRANRQAMR